MLKRQAPTIMALTMPFCPRVFAGGRPKGGGWRGPHGIWEWDQSPQEAAIRGRCADNIACYYIRSLVEEPGHWGCGPDQPAKAQRVFILWPGAPPPPHPPPSSLQEAFRSSEADPPLNPTMYHYPWFQETKAPAGQHPQKGPEAQECSNDEWVLPSPSPGIARDLPL